jgi:hypothetical protein
VCASELLYRAWWSVGGRDVAVDECLAGSMLGSMRSAGLYNNAV